MSQGGREIMVSFEHCKMKTVKRGNGQLAFIRENYGNTMTVKNAKASDQSMDFNIMCFSVKNNHRVHCIFFKNVLEFIMILRMSHFFPSV